MKLHNMSWYTSSTFFFFFGQPQSRPGPSVCDMAYHSASTWLLSVHFHLLLAPKLQCQKILWASVSESDASSAPDDIHSILSCIKG